MGSASRILHFVISFFDSSSQQISITSPASLINRRRRDDIYARIVVAAYEAMAVATSYDKRKWTRSPHISVITLDASRSSFSSYRYYARMRKPLQQAGQLPHARRFRACLVSAARPNFAPYVRP